MSRRRRVRSQMTGIDEINMTPLLDLTFLLLIVFMLSMPLMEYGTDVKVPEMNAKKLPDENYKYITLQGDGSVEIDKQVISRAELPARLAQLKNTMPDAQINLRSDGNRKYEEIIDLLKEIRPYFNKVNLVTQAERK